MLAGVVVVIVVVVVRLYYNKPNANNTLILYLEYRIYLVHLSLPLYLYLYLPVLESERKVIDTVLFPEPDVGGGHTHTVFVHTHGDKVTRTRAHSLMYS